MASKSKRRAAKQLVAAVGLAICVRNTLAAVLSAGQPGTDRVL